MKPEIKDKWLAALRSGEYSQGRGHLRCNDSYCCLGVLSDIYSKETGTEWTEPDQNGVRHIEDDKGILPTCVMLWAGLQAINPIVDYDGSQRALSRINDSHVSFANIANIIEKQL